MLNTEEILTNLESDMTTLRSLINHLVMVHGMARVYAEVNQHPGESDEVIIAHLVEYFANR